MHRLVESNQLALARTGAVLVPVAVKHALSAAPSDPLKLKASTALHTSADARHTHGNHGFVGKHAAAAQYAEFRVEHVAGVGPGTAGQTGGGGGGGAVAPLMLARRFGPSRSGPVVLENSFVSP